MMTHQLSLRCALPTDAARYHTLQRDLRSEPELIKFLGFRDIRTPIEYEKTLTAMQGNADCPFIIIRKDNNTFAGICGFRWNEFVRAQEIYVWLDKASRGKHYGTETVEALLKLAFSLDWPLVVAVPHPENSKSLKLLSAIKMPQFACVFALDSWDLFGSTHAFPVYCRHKDCDLDVFV